MPKAKRVNKNYKGLMVCFGLLTMSSTITYTNTTMTNNPSAYYESTQYELEKEPENLLPFLFKPQTGDFFIDDNPEDCIPEHRKIRVKLNIQKIRKYVPSFDFEEDEYEEM